VKRRLREVFRAIRHELPQGIDWVVIPKKGVSPGIDELQDSFRRLARQLEVKLANFKDGPG
ncbi:MAG: ribonuclease P protein component, partial [Planctomycetota bacterium]